MSNSFIKSIALIRCFWRFVKAMTYVLVFLLLMLSQSLSYAIEVNEVLTVQKSSSETGLQLTADEQNWLNQHKNIRIAYDGSLPPYSFVNDTGKIDGIAFEIMTLLSQRLGVDFTLYPNSNWTGIYKAAARRKVDVVATMVNRPDRSAWFSFTKPYLTKSLVIVTKLDNTTINSRDDLGGKKIAVVKGYQYAEQFGKDFPTAKRVNVDNMQNSLEQVSLGQVDAAILFMGTANYLQAKHQLDSLKVAAYYDRNNANESIAVRKDWPIFVGILQKGLDSLTEQDVQKVFAKWIVGNPIATADTVQPQPQPVLTPDKPLIKEIEQKPASYNIQNSPVETSVDTHDIQNMLIVALLVGVFFFMWLMLIRKQKKLRLQNKAEMVASASHESLQSTNEGKEHATIENTIEISSEEFKPQLQEQSEQATNEYIYYQHDLEGRFSYVSASVASLLGYSESDFMANYRHYLTDNPVNRHIDSYTDACIQGQPNAPYEIEIYDAGQGRRWLEVMDTPIYDGQGHCIGVDGVMHDITAQKLMSVSAPQAREPEAVSDANDPKILIEQVSAAIKSANQYLKSFALIYLSMDRLRLLDGSLINYSDKNVFKEASKRLHSTLRTTDTVVQLGIDKYALILTETELDVVGLIVDKIRKILQIPYLVGIQSIVLDANIGCAVYPGKNNDPEALIDEAKASLSFVESQLSKQASSNKDDTYQSNTLRLQLDLVDVLDECKVSLRVSSAENINALNRNNQLAVFYQSRHYLEDYSINSFEALIRWHHPKLGLLLPQDFVGLIKDIGMLDVMTYWIIQQVSFQAVVWESQGIRPNLIAINLDDLATKQAVDVAKIIALIKETGAKPEWLQFSIPESEIGKNPDKVILIIKELVAEGLSVTIDNFGLDRTLLMQLKSIPVQIIEIDATFIRGLPGNTGNAEIISSTIELLHDLGKTVIAKEVETEQQLEFLKARGCDVFQGHLLSRPLPANEAKVLMESLPDLAWYLRQT